MKKSYLLYCLLVVSIPLILSSCDGFWKLIRYSREDLMYPVENNTSNALRTDGYYYHFIDTNNGHQCFHELVFYRDGVVYGDMGAMCYDSISQMDSSMSSDIYIRDTPWFWGAYRILHDDTIQIQKWMMNDGTDPLYIYTGVILSDTTFRLFSERKSKHLDEETKLDKVFLFRSLKTKRDSINPFVPEID